MNTWSLVGLVLAGIGVLAAIVVFILNKKKSTTVPVPVAVRVASLPPPIPTGTPGASGRLTIYKEMSFFKVGEEVIFEAGSLNTDKEGGATNIADFSVQLPNGQIVEFKGVEIKASEYFSKHIPYIVKAEDLINCETGCKIKATLILTVKNSLGDKTKYTLEKSVNVEK